MREQPGASAGPGPYGSGALGAAHRLGSLLGATRHTVVYEALANAEGAADAVAKMARRDRRHALASDLRAEGELLLRVRHPNVARGVEVGESDEHGTYLIRERVDGVDLAAYLRREGALPVERSRDVAVALLDAVGALAQGRGEMVEIDPSDVWIEERSGRVVVVGVAPARGSERARVERVPVAVADMVAACARGRLESGERARARVRAEVVRDARKTPPAVGLSPQLGEIIELCVAAAADPNESDLSALRDRVGRASAPTAEPVPGDASVHPGCRARAAEVESLLRASIDLEISRDQLSVPEGLPRLLERANQGGERAAEGEPSWGELENELRRVADALGGVVIEVTESRAAALEADWQGFRETAGDLVTNAASERFSSALGTVRGEVARARYHEASAALVHASEALAEARGAARALAEQQARAEVDVLARELDRLEEAFPGARLDPGLEPRRVRSEVQALVVDGKLVDAVRHVRNAVAAVEGERERHEKAGLHVTARELAERALALRRREKGGDPASKTLDVVESRLAEMVELLGRGALAEARTVSEGVRDELKRLDWERELVGSDSGPPPAQGVAEVDEVRRAAARLEADGGSTGGREDLEHAVGRLETVADGAFGGAIVRLRALARRSAWDAFAAALLELRENLLRAVEGAPGADVEFRASPGLAEVLRILAEAERDAPPASDLEAERLRELRESGEAMLARLDALRARDVAPVLVEQLVEHCAAAADAERRGEHAQAIDELTEATALLKELLAATEGTGAGSVEPAAERSENELSALGAVEEDGGDLAKAAALGGRAAHRWPAPSTDWRPYIGLGLVLASLARNGVSMPRSIRDLHITTYRWCGKRSL